MMTDFYEYLEKFRVQIRQEDGLRKLKEAVASGAMNETKVRAANFVINEYEERIFSESKSKETVRTVIPIKTLLCNVWGYLKNHILHVVISGVILMWIASMFGSK